MATRRWDRRLYDSETGRFMSVDPLYEAFTEHNPYHYAYNSPLIFRDPTGLAPEGEEKKESYREHEMLALQVNLKKSEIVGYNLGDEICTEAGCYRMIDLIRSDLSGLSELEKQMTVPMGPGGGRGSWAGTWLMSGSGLGNYDKGLTGDGGARGGLGAGFTMAGYAGGSGSVDIGNGIKLSRRKYNEYRNWDNEKKLLFKLANTKVKLENFEDLIPYLELTPTGKELLAVYRESIGNGNSFSYEHNSEKIASVAHPKGRSGFHNALWETNEDGEKKYIGSKIGVTILVHNLLDQVLVTAHELHHLVQAYNHPKEYLEHPPYWEVPWEENPIEFTKPGWPFEGAENIKEKFKKEIFDLMKKNGIR
jgi:hypothetical protein